MKSFVLLILFVSTSFAQRYPGVNYQNQPEGLICAQEKIWKELNFDYIPEASTTSEQMKYMLEFFRPEQAPPQNLLDDVLEEFNMGVCRNTDDWLNCASVALALQRRRNHVQVKSLIKSAEQMLEQKFKNGLATNFDTYPENLNQVTKTYALVVFAGIAVSKLTEDTRIKLKWYNQAGRLFELGAAGYTNGSFVPRSDLAEKYFRAVGNNNVADMARANNARTLGQFYINGVFMGRSKQLVCSPKHPILKKKAHDAYLAAGLDWNSLVNPYLLTKRPIVKQDKKQVSNGRQIY